MSDTGTNEGTDQPVDESQTGETPAEGAPVEGGEPTGDAGADGGGGTDGGDTAGDTGGEQSPPQPEPQTDTGATSGTEEPATTTQEGGAGSVDDGEPLPEGVEAGSGDVQNLIDDEQEQGFRGAVADETPNHAYTVAGVLANEETPEQSQPV